LPYLEIEAIKGGPQDPQSALWNDEYGEGEAGSPYQPPGLGSIYEADTVRGASFPAETTTVSAPEPSSFISMLGLGVLSWAGLRRRAKRRK
jgi:hypothetical protein